MVSSPILETQIWKDNMTNNEVSFSKDSKSVCLVDDATISYNSKWRVRKGNESFPQIWNPKYGDVKWEKK